MLQKIKRTDAHQYQLGDSENVWFWSFCSFLFSFLYFGDDRVFLWLDLPLLNLILSWDTRSEWNADDLPGTLGKGPFQILDACKNFPTGLKPSFMGLLNLPPFPPSPKPQSSPLFMDSGTPDILMVSAMPPMAATFIFMASSCPRHLFGHLGKTREAQVAALPAPQPGPSSFYGRRKRPMRGGGWDLCNQSPLSADLRPGGSEGWDGMLKCLNCGMHRASKGGGGEGHQTLISSKANLSRPCRTWS